MNISLFITKTQQQFRFPKSLWSMEFLSFTLSNSTSFFSVNLCVRQMAEQIHKCKVVLHVIKYSNELLISIFGSINMLIYIYSHVITYRFYHCIELDPVVIDKLHIWRHTEYLTERTRPVSITDRARLYNKSR